MLISTCFSKEKLRIQVMMQARKRDLLQTEVRKFSLE